MLKSPLGVMFPDGTLPAFNDSGPTDLFSEAPLYEAAYSALKDPEFAAIDEHVGRNNRAAFLFGVPSIDGAVLPQPKSAVFPKAGYATLRAPAGDLTEIVKFGPHGGPHGHFDKLNEIIFAKGVTMSVDPGTHLYGLPIHASWDKMTIAHNTVTVDETSQKGAQGKLLNWQVEPDFTAVTADAGAVYDNVDLQRTSILTSDYVLEITTGKSTDGEEHDFDWAYHNIGVQRAEGAFAPYSGFPQKDGYQHLTDNQSAQIKGDLHTVFVVDHDKEMNLWVVGGGQVFTGETPGRNLEARVPYVIVRRHGTSEEFIALMAPGPAEAKILSVTSEGGTIRIKSSRWEDTIKLGATIEYQRAPLP